MSSFKNSRYLTNFYPKPSLNQTVDSGRLQGLFLRWNQFVIRSGFILFLSYITREK